MTAVVVSGSGQPAARLGAQALTRPSPASLRENGHASTRHTGVGFRVSLEPDGWARHSLRPERSYSWELSPSSVGCGKRGGTAVLFDRRRSPRSPHCGWGTSSSW